MRHHPTSSAEAPRVGGMLGQQNHAAGGGGNGSIMVGMFVCLCLARPKAFQEGVLVSTRTDLGVKLLVDDR
jgi:hypothetical protein